MTKNVLLHFWAEILNKLDSKLNTLDSNYNITTSFPTNSHTIENLIPELLKDEDFNDPISILSKNHNKPPEKFPSFPVSSHSPKATIDVCTDKKCVTF